MELAEVPDWAATWLTERAQRAAKPAATIEKDAAPADPEAARRRAEQRAARVADGLEELDRWLADQVRTGLVGAQRGGHAHFEQVAARMVDAQAPAVASALRRLPWVAAGGEGWHGRLLEELAALRLVVVAHRRLPDLPADLAATVRARVGYPVAREEVLAEPGVADEWAVLGMYDSADERLTKRWWEDLVEARLDGGSPFDAITAAMAELRADAPPVGAAEQAREERREAHMRVVLRTALKEGHGRVAVVCGAWHAPALTGRLPSAAADAKVLRGLPKRRATLTWVPWTHGRLASASGYGAGITSPGWYHHLFAAPDRPVTRWLTGVAGTLRGEDLPVSSAHVIEAVRLAETLATLRGRPLAGLDEVQEATRAVLCEGDDLMLDLVTRRLVVGEALGSVPDSAPSVPLEADLRGPRGGSGSSSTRRRPPSSFDLRKPNDLDRSRLLHRLLLLGVDWGAPARAASRNLGTFREAWSLQWRPELAIALVEASIWGTTVEAAAGARIADAATGGTLPELTAAVERCLLADLPVALPVLLAALDARAAIDVDVAHLMAAVPPLVRAARYGDVRATDTHALLHVTGAILLRICAGLHAALTGLDADAAQAMVDGVDAVNAALATWGDEAARDRWLSALAGLADRDDLNGLLVGRLIRLLLDATRLDGEEAATRLARALSVGTPAGTKAAWVEGFLAGGGTLLVHDQALLALLDGWVAALDEQAFTDVLPLLRRTFGTFTGPERRAMADRLWQPAGGAAGVRDVHDVDPARAAAAVATVALLLGLGAP